MQLVAEMKLWISEECLYLKIAIENHHGIMDVKPLDKIRKEYFA